jgi:5'(3')-deoxyribonucleotidase
MRIFLDMDEVLADFTGSAIALHGFTRERLELGRPPGEWDITKVLGISQDEFWKPINEKGEEFWKGLKPLPWMYDVLSLVESLTSDWYVVTSPCRNSCCYSGKAWWFDKFFPALACDKLIITGHKYLLAKGRSTILIDDRESNVKKFRQAGGNAFTFPTRGNNGHARADNPVDYIKTSLQYQYLRS